MRMGLMLARCLVVGGLTVAGAHAAPWQRTNGPFTARLSSISVRHSSPQEFLLSTDTRVYRTADGGATYQRVLQAPGELTRHPRRPALVFTNASRSADGGVSWTPLGRSFEAFAFSPTDSSLIYALGESSRDGQWAIDLYRSGDSGGTFVLRSTVHESYRWLGGGSVSVDRGDPNLLFCTVHPKNQPGLLYRSVDGGSTWTQIAGPEARVVMVACDPNNASTVFVMAERDLYASDDRGETWTRLANIPGNWYERAAVLFDPYRPGEMVVANGTGAWRSQDSGTTWTTIASSPSGGLAFFSTAWSPGGDYLVATDSEAGSSLWVTGNGGSNWSALATPSEPVALNRGGGKLAADPTDPERAYTGSCCGEAVYATADGGATWTRTDGRGGGGIVVHPSVPSHVYVMGDGQVGLWESRDWGRTWAETSYRRSMPAAPSIVTTVAFAPARPATLYLAAYVGGADSADAATWAKLYVSDDGGGTWEELPFREYCGAIMGIAVKSGNPDSLLVVTDQIDAFRSTDGGYNWTRTRKLGSSLGRRQMAVDPADPDVSVVAAGEALYVTRDLGLSWVARTPPRYEVDPPLVTHPGAGITRLIVPGGADGSLQVSDDLGETWTSVSTGIPDRLGIVAASANGLYYANTDTSGVIKGRIDVPAISGLRSLTDGRLAIRGLGFGSSQGSGSVKFNRTTATVVAWQDTEVVCYPLTLSGSVTLVLTTDGGMAATRRDALSGISAPSPVLAPGTITTIAGTGVAGYSGDGGQAVEAQLNRPWGVGVGADGRVYIADWQNNRIRRIDLDGNISTVAGTGELVFSPDGMPAQEAGLFGPTCAVPAADGSLLAAEAGRIIRIGLDGLLHVVAGGNGMGYSGDGGLATQAMIKGPPGQVAADAAGNVYLADAGNNCIRKVNTDGIITTIAGTGTAGYSGDGGPATQAMMNSPNGLSVDAGGIIYFADWQNNRVRRVMSDGTISTVAGSGQGGYSGDGGPAIQARLSGPKWVAVGPDGEFYISDSGNNRIRRVGADGVITTIAGSGVAGSSGDGGPGTQAQLSSPAGLAVDAHGYVYIADTDNNRIRRVTPGQGASTPPSASAAIRLSATTLAFNSTQVGGSAVQTISVSNTGSAALNVTGATVTGTGANQFTVSPTTFTVEASGPAQTVTVTFAPTTIGTKSASLSLVHNAPGSPSYVSLTGTATAVPAPDIALSPAELDFGQVRLTGRSDLVVSIQNTGTLPLAVDTVRVSGAGFAASASSMAVAAGGRAVLTLSFIPTAAGSAAGQLILVSNDPDEGRLTVPLSGIGRLAHVTVSADTLDFGRVTVGSTGSQILTITNNSSAAIAVSNVVPGDPQYAVSSRAFTLAAGGSRDVTVTLTPLEGRALAATLTVLTNDAEVPALTVVLAATSGVVGGAPVITLLPTSLTFGSVGIGQSRTATLFVTNDGSTNLRVVNVVSSSGDVSVSETGFTVAPGGEKQMIVTLQPSQAGSFSETLEMQSNDPARPLVTIPLRATVTTGTGRPTLALDTPSLSFGQVAIGETSEFLLPVRNAGTATLTISNTVSDNVQVVASPTSLSVPPQESRALTVRYRPMPGMPLSGRLTLYSNDTAQPQVGVAWSALEVRSPYLSLTRVTPADRAFGVATTAEIQLVFNEPLYYRRGFTALDVAVTPEPLSGPVEADLQVRGDGRTVVIPVSLARNTVYRVVVYGATGRSGLELFDMVEASFSTGTAPPVLAKVSGRVTEATGLAVSGSVYLMDSSHRLSAQASVAMDGSFEIAGVGEGSYTLYLDGAIADGRAATGSYDLNGDGVADALTVRAGIDQTGLTMAATVRSGTTPVVSSSLVAVDLDSSAGNQGQASLSGVAGDQAVVLEVYATAAEAWTGAAVTVAYDSTKVSFAGVAEGDNLLRQNGGTALFLSHVDPAASTVEYGGAILGATATTAVSGSGLLGRFRFTVLDGFSGETALRVTLVKVHTLTGRTDVEPNLTAILRSSGGGSTPATSTGPLTLDFNTADGDQGQTTGSGATVGKTYQVQVYAVGAPTINGWSAKIEYDPVQVQYVSGSFQPSTMVAGLLSLVEEKSSYVSIGGAVLGGSGTGSGSGLLGTATFEVLSGFTGSTELVIRQMSWKVVGSGEQMLSVEVRGTISAATAGLAGDFNDDGAVNFSDFFMFADAFGGSDPAYDLTADGAVNFSDFFVFADAFGTEARGKLMELAHQYLGLPTKAGLESTWPNPFNAATTIRYRLSAPGLVTLAVYGLTGQRVNILVDEWQEAGSHEVAWDGRDEDGVAAATGAYLIRLAGPSEIQVRKVTLLR